MTSLNLAGKISLCHLFSLEPRLPLFVTYSMEKHFVQLEKLGTRLFVIVIVYLLSSGDNDN